MSNGRWIVHRECTGNAERAGAKQWIGDRCQWAVAVWGVGLTGNEPCQQAAIEFLRGSRGGTAVFGTGNFPELSDGIAGADAAGVADGDVAVKLAVDEQNRDVVGGYGIFRGDFLHVQLILPTGAEKGDFDQRAEDGASEPWTEMERLSHAVIGNFAEICERRFGGDGAELWVSVERLQELRGSHGFAEGEDAAGMILRVEKIEPLMNVVAFKQSVGGERSAA